MAPIYSHRPEKVESLSWLWREEEVTMRNSRRGAVSLALQMEEGLGNVGTLRSRKSKGSRLSPTASGKE